MAEQNFKENYAILKNIADTLRSQQEPDIDALVPLVDQATQAYKACQARIDAVNAALEERLGSELPNETPSESEEITGHLDDVPPPSSDDILF